MSMNRKIFYPDEAKVIVIIGTRPDTVKLAPVYLALKKRGIPTILCTTGQHADLVKNLFPLFQIAPDFNFAIMKNDQDLFDSTTSILQHAKALYQKTKPSLVVVQGDTTSALSAALAAFYQKIPIAHVEAGLRTSDASRPFPEEMNRRLISQLSTLHFAPTSCATRHLINENIPAKNIYCTGNTGVDTLYEIQKLLTQRQINPSQDIAQCINHLKKSGQKILLFTAHRRESFEKGLSQIYRSIERALIAHPLLHVIYPLHPNPTISKVFLGSKLSQMSRVHVFPALAYPDLIYVLKQADAIATDSGGIQEETISMNLPVIVLREETDRPEGIEEGLVHLVGFNGKKFLSAIEKNLKKHKKIPKKYRSTYGDGKASERIAAIIQKFIRKRNP
jgi:UDP-N-acetylglucosamine 2-epimerase (non-hydrolysing)